MTYIYIYLIILSSDWAGLRRQPLLCDRLARESVHQVPKSSALGASGLNRYLECSDLHRFNIGQMGTKNYKEAY